jgi:hypothetical protein
MMPAAQVVTETRVLLSTVDSIMVSDTYPYHEKLHLREIIRRNIIN